MTPEHTPWSSKNASSSRSHWKMCEPAAPEERAKGNPVRQTGARISRRREAAESPRRARCEPTQKWNLPDWALVAAQKRGTLGAWLRVATPSAEEPSRGFILRAGGGRLDGNRSQLFDDFTGYASRVLGSHHLISVGTAEEASSEGTKHGTSFFFGCQ